MGVTDKAVSKWERNLCCPDIDSIPKLAQILEISVEELMQGENGKTTAEPQVQEIVSLVLKAVPLAMGVAVTVLEVLNRLDQKSAFVMLGLGLSCVAISMLQ